MRNRLILLAGLALAAAPLQGQRRPAAPADDILVGQVLKNSLGDTVNGWSQLGISVFPKRVTKGYVITETNDCCVVLYQRGSRFIVARAQPVVRRPDGEVVTLRVLTTELLTARPDEEEAECRLPGNGTYLTLKDSKTGWLRSVIISGEAFVTITWKDPGDFCHSDY